MEIWSTRSFNAIPATLIRVFLTCIQTCHIKYNVNNLFIYSFIYLLFPFLLTIVIFFYLWQIYTYFSTFSLTTHLERDIYAAFFILKILA